MRRGLHDWEDHRSDGFQAGSILEEVFQESGDHGFEAVVDADLEALLRDLDDYTLEGDGDVGFDDELPSYPYGIRREIDRSSSSYVRWYQAALNRIIAAGLDVDGLSGPATRSAVMAFQSERGLAADGVVGPATEAALVSAGAGSPPLGSTPTVESPGVDTPLPAEGSGYYVKNGDNQSERWGTAATIRAIQAIGARWARRMPRGPRFGVTAVSLQGGGDTPFHQTHEDGLDVDIRPVRNDGQEAGTDVHSPAYSYDLTVQLVDDILRNGVLTVKQILFNDQRIVDAYPGKVKPLSGHDNHLHIDLLPA